MSQHLSLGRIVLYASNNSDGIVSPAIVLRTRATTNLKANNRWGPTPEGTLSGKGRPAALVPEFPDDHTIGLLALGVDGGYREYCIPCSENGEPGARSWTPRI